MATVTAATVEAVLRVRDNNFAVSMNRADQAVKKTEQSAKALTTRLEQLATIGGRLGGALTTGLSAPLLAVGAAAVKATVDLDSLKRGLTAVAGSSAEAERQMVRLREIARMPGLGFNEAIQGSIRLQAAGLSAQLAEKSLREFGNAIATVGGGKEQLDGVTLALSQIASKGKVSAEEINQLNERVPQITQAMIAAFGTADTEILQRANITATEFVNSITAVFARDQRVGDTLKNNFENAQQQITESLDRIGRAITPRVAAALGAVADGVERLTRAFDGLARYQQDLLVNLGIAGLIAGPVLAGLAKVAELVLTIRSAAAGGAVAGAAGLGARGAAGVLGAAAVSTAPITVPLMLAGGGAWVGAQESIANSDRQIGQLTASNPQRIAQLEGDIARERKVVQQLGSRNPNARGHQQRINAMQAEINALSRVEAGQAARGALRMADPKRIIADIMSRPAPLIDANARAAANKKPKTGKTQAQRDAERIGELNERIGNEIERMVAEKKSKFSADRVGNAQEYEQLLRDGVRPDLALRWYNLHDQQVASAERLEAAVPMARALGQGLDRIGQIPSNIANAILASRRRSAERQRALMAGSAEMQASLAMSNPALGTLAVPRGNAALSASPMQMAMPSSFVGNPAGTLSMPMIRAQMAASDTARLGGGVASGAFMDLMQGRNVIGNALERVKTGVFESIGNEIGRGVERSLRKRLTSVFEDAIGDGVGEKLEKSLEASLGGIQASAGAILSGAYSLISALSRRKQFGLGSVLGGIGGFFLGGPAGAIQGYNIGNAIDNRDYGGAIMGGLAASAGSATAGGGATAQPGPADGRSIIIQNFGNQYGIDDVEGASLRQGRALQRALACGGG